MKKQLFFVLLAFLTLETLSATSCVESGRCPKEMVERLRQEKQAEREKQKQNLPPQPLPEEQQPE